MQNLKKMKLNESILSMLRRYDLSSLQDYKNAIKEIVQEIALLGLWRAKFFEKGVFYGGTALRILHQLDRFSEDLDFSLIHSDSSFDISQYEKAIQEELASFGFITKLEKKKKAHESVIDSAFIKMNTIQHLLLVGIPSGVSKAVHPEETIQIRLEVDTDPPIDDLVTESVVLLLPIPFSVKTYRLEDLFAGKVHAVLCREWKGRVKGRDWYDLIWFISRNVSLNLQHLEKRMRQSGHWTRDSSLNQESLMHLFEKKISHLDVESAKDDVIRFIKDKSSLDLWSPVFFKQVARKIKCEQA